MGNPAVLRKWSKEAKFLKLEQVCLTNYWQEQAKTWQKGAFFVRQMSMFVNIRTLCRSYFSLCVLCDVFKKWPASLGGFGVVLNSKKERNRERGKERQTEISQSDRVSDWVGVWTKERAWERAGEIERERWMNKVSRIEKMIEWQKKRYCTLKRGRQIPESTRELSRELEGAREL